MAFEIAKAGWLFRQSSVLKRWKKNWFVLYQDGMLRYFENPEDPTAEDAFLMKAKCLDIITGLDILEVSPPAGCGRSCLLQIKFTDSTLTLCAESPDDMNAWQISLEQARVLQSQSNTVHHVHGMNPYGSGATTVVYQYPAGYQPPPYMVNGPIFPGQMTVIYTDRPYYRRGYNGTDMATGMLAGAAVGTMMWGPLLWW